MANWVTLAINELVCSIKGEQVVLRDKFKYEISYSAIDFEEDELITKKGAEGLIQGNAPVLISIPAGSAIPFMIDMTNILYQGVEPNFSPQVSLLLNGNYGTATRSRTVYDVPVEKVWTDSSRSVLSQLAVYGYPNDVGDATINDLILII